MSKEPWYSQQATNNPCNYYRAGFCVLLICGVPHLKGASYVFINLWTHPHRFVDLWGQLSKNKILFIYLFQYLSLNLFETSIDTIINS